MSKYIIRRTLIAIPMLIIISMMTYLFINLAPGDPLDAMIDPEFFAGASSDLLRERMGLNKPIYVRYLIWLRELATGNFGYSYQFGIPVLDMMKVKQALSKSKSRLRKTIVPPITWASYL